MCVFVYGMYLNAADASRKICEKKKGLKGRRNTRPERMKGLARPELGDLDAVICHRMFLRQVH